MTAVTWAQSADRRVWVAEGLGGALLTVTQLGRDRWVRAVLDVGGRTR